jgi:hypothetical protein
LKRLEAKWDLSPNGLTIEDASFEYVKDGWVGSYQDVTRCTSLEMKANDPTLSYKGAPKIADLQVHLRLVHSFPRDLVIFIAAKDGPVVELMRHTGPAVTDTSNKIRLDMNVIFSDAGKVCPQSLTALADWDNGGLPLELATPGAPASTCPQPYPATPHQGVPVDSELSVFNGLPIDTKFVVFVCDAVSDVLDYYRDRKPRAKFYDYFVNIRTGKNGVGDDGAILGAGLNLGYDFAGQAQPPTAKLNDVNVLALAQYRPLTTGSVSQKTDDLQLANFDAKVNLEAVDVGSKDGKLVGCGATDVLQFEVDRDYIINQIEYELGQPFEEGDGDDAVNDQLPAFKAITFAPSDIEYKYIMMYQPKTIDISINLRDMMTVSAENDNKDEDLLSYQLYYETQKATLGAEEAAVAANVQQTKSDRAGAWAALYQEGQEGESRPNQVGMLTPANPASKSMSFTFTLDDGRNNANGGPGCLTRNLYTSIKPTDSGEISMVMEAIPGAYQTAKIVTAIEMNQQRSSSDADNNNNVYYNTDKGDRVATFGFPSARGGLPTPNAHDDGLKEDLLFFSSSFLSIYQVVNWHTAPVIQSTKISAKEWTNFIYENTDLTVADWGEGREEALAEVKKQIRNKMGPGADKAIKGFVGGTTASAVSFYGTTQVSVTLPYKGDREAGSNRKATLQTNALTTVIAIKESCDAVETSQLTQIPH